MIWRIVCETVWQADQEPPSVLRVCAVPVKYLTLMRIAKDGNDLDIYNGYIHVPQCLHYKKYLFKLLNVLFFNESTFTSREYVLINEISELLGKFQKNRG
jgi:hypothetical protein